jgi:bifunctional DNA-binding transcriptional regulator/antitoxin component of YhaV-PrlF toxin-antitoxin module
MKSIERKTDALGRVLIPKYLRSEYGILEEGSDVELVPLDEGVLIRKLKQTCAICGNDSDLVDLNGKCICEGCIERIQSIRNGN